MAELAAADAFGAAEGSLLIRGVAGAASVGAAVALAELGLGWLVVVTTDSSLPQAESTKVISSRT